MWRASGEYQDDFEDDESGRCQAVRYRAIVANLIERSLVALLFSLLPILVSGPGLTQAAVVLALQLLNAAGWWIQQNVWWYATGVTWLLLSVGYLFFFAVRGWVRGV